ncbi:MAG: tRNA (guanine(10)-N(2))-dimethyltransferase [Candidatus Micrarchaeota archaeon]|nr:tRNA (guanine(10)-N(2))-dimethyltransferase [Candidatus Micrarchaeota archaeon]
MGEISEGKVKITAPAGVFYNPEMELCRDIGSLAVGALGGKLSLVDAMAASGVRGLRYKKENRNVASLTLVDLSPKAVATEKKNARANKVKCECVYADANKFLYENEFDFVELDPFGSPMPFLNDAVRSFKTKKKGYLSVTATDMAVLCGAHHAACLKNYGAMPLDNEFCHENATRILAAKVVLTAAPMNFSATPIFTISHRHYVKMIFALEQGAEGAVAAVKQNGFVSYCEKCCYRETARLPRKQDCPSCGTRMVHGGPVYLGALWDEKLLEKMLKLNVQRKYRRSKEIEKLLSTMKQEGAIASYGYYDLHKLAKKMKTSISSMDDAIGKLKRAGFAASRTHFCPTAVRTDAPHEAVLKVLCK